MKYSRFIKFLVLTFASCLVFQLLTGCQNKDELVTDLHVDSYSNKSVETLFTDYDTMSDEIINGNIDALDDNVVVAIPEKAELQNDNVENFIDESELRQQVEFDGIEYAVNTNTKKFHLPECGSVAQIKEKNLSHEKDRDKLISGGYDPCKRCNP